MRLKLVLPGFFALSLGILAQQSVEPVPVHAGSVEQTISVSVDRVNVLFTVSGQTGKLITNLKKNDFKVFEDGQPQSISNFSREPDVPLNIGLLVDTSGSVWGKLRFEREAATKFFYSILTRERDRAFVMAFDSNAVVLQDFTNSPAILHASIEHMIAGGSTSLYDSIASAAVPKLASRQGQRILIVLSDGFDNASHLDLTAAIEAAQRNDVIIYAISTNQTDGLLLENPVRADANLKRLAAETGGYAMFPKRSEDLTQAFGRITADLRAEYSLAYGPTNSRKDGTYRSIHIVPMRKGYTVRCRHGYFAPHGRSA